MAIQVPKPFLVCLVAILVGISSISKANAQASIVAGITANVTGQLFCSPNAALPGLPLANATVNLVVGNTIIATSTTSANGTFTINANVSFINILGAAVTVNLPIRTCPALANVTGLLIGFPLRVSALGIRNGGITIALQIPSPLTRRPA